MKNNNSILSNYYNQKLTRQKTVARSLLPNLEFGGDSQYAFRKRKFEKSEPEQRIDPKLKFFNGGFLMPAKQGGESFAGIYGKRNYNQNVLTNFEPGGFTLTTTTTLDPRETVTYSNIPGHGLVGTLSDVIIKGRKKAFTKEEYNQAFKTARQWYEDYFNSPMYAKMVEEDRGYPYYNPMVINGRPIFDYSKFVPEFTPEKYPAEDRRVGLDFIDYAVADQKANDEDASTMASQSEDFTKKNILSTTNAKVQNYDHRPVVTMYDNAFKAQRRDNKDNPNYDGYNELIRSFIHEIGHGANAGGKRVSYNTNNLIRRHSSFDYIGSPMYYNDMNNPESLELLQKGDPEFLRKRKEYFDYLQGEPDETIQRIRDLRYEMQRQQIYNPFNESFKKEYLQKYKQGTNNPGADPLQQLRFLFDDDAITEMLNKVARNEKTNPVINNTGNSLINSKYGGEPEPTPLELAKIKAKMALESHFGNPSARRMTTPYPQDLVFKLNAGPDKGKMGRGTHWMGTIDNYAVPNIQDGSDGKLFFNQNASPLDREAMRFNSPEEALMFAENYKEVAPMMRSFKKNGGDISIPNLKEGNWLDRYEEGGQLQQFAPGGFLTTFTTTINPKQLQQWEIDLLTKWGNQKSKSTKPVANPNQKDKGIYWDAKEGSWKYRNFWTGDEYSYISTPTMQGSTRPQGWTEDVVVTGTRPKSQIQEPNIDDYYIRDNNGSIIGFDSEGWAKVNNRSIINIDADQVLTAGNPRETTHNLNAEKYYGAPGKSKEQAIQDYKAVRDRPLTTGEKIALGAIVLPMFGIMGGAAVGMTGGLGLTALSGLGVTGSTLSAAATTPMFGIPGFTAGNALTAYGVTDFARRATIEVPGQIQRGEYADAAASLGWGVLDVLALHGANPSLFKNTGAAFNKAGNWLTKNTSLKNTYKINPGMDTANPWSVQELPGLHLKSTMSNGPIAKIVEPKTGLVNVEQALAIIGKESGGADKVALIKQGLGENIPKKMDYNDFRKIVQDQLIPLDIQINPQGNSSYGLSSIGYDTKKRDMNLIQKELQDLISGNNTDISSLSKGTRDVITGDGNISILDMNALTQGRHEYLPIDNVLNKIKSNEKLLDIAFNKNYINSTPLENNTITFSNKTKFGKGSNAHNNPDETLGHIHFLRDAETPDILTVTQIQSDAFQGTHRRMPKGKLTKTGDPIDNDYIDEAGRYFDTATGENIIQKSLLDKTHQERYLQELVNYAGERGDLAKIRLPTSETAAKIQGYTPVTTAEEIIQKHNKLKGTPEWDELISETPDADKIRLEKILKGEVKGDIYDLENTTILKKYSELPKTIKKLFGVETKIVTDSKGNTWYEFDIPEGFKGMKGEIKAFKKGGQLQRFANGGSTGFKITTTTTLPPTETKYTHNPSNNGKTDYAIRRTVTPYKTEEEIKRFTQIPASGEDVDFNYWYRNASNQKDATSVPFEGDKHWNIDRGIIDVQFGRNYPNLNQSNTTLEQNRNNALADMYKYYMLQYPNNRDKAWRHAQRFVKKEIDPRINNRYFTDILTNKVAPNMGTLTGFADENPFKTLDNYNLMFVENPDVASAYHPGYNPKEWDVNRMRGIVTDYLRDYKGMSRRDVRRQVRDWEKEVKGTIRAYSGTPINTLKKSVDDVNITDDVIRAARESEELAFAPNFEQLYKNPRTDQKQLAGADRMVEWRGVDNLPHRRLFTGSDADNFMKYLSDNKLYTGTNISNTGILNEQDRKEFKIGGQLEKFLPKALNGFELTSTTTLPPDVKELQEIVISADNLPYEERKALWIKQHMNKPWPSFYQTPSNLEWNFEDSTVSTGKPKFTPEGVEIEYVQPTEEELGKYFDEIYMYGGKDESPKYDRKTKEFQCPPDESGRLKINVDGNCVYYDELTTNVFQTNKKGAFTTDAKRMAGNFADKNKLPLVVGPSVVIPQGAEELYKNSPYYKNVDLDKKRPENDPSRGYGSYSQTNPETGDPTEQELNQTLQYIHKNGLRATGYGDGWLIKPGQYSDWTDDRLRNAVQGITQRSPGYTPDQNWKVYAPNLEKLYNSNDVVRNFFNTSEFGNNYRNATGAGKSNAWYSPVTNFVGDIATGTLMDVAKGTRYIDGALGLSENNVLGSTPVYNTYGENINSQKAMMYERNNRKQNPGLLGFQNLPVLEQAGRDLVTSGKNFYNDPSLYGAGNVLLNAGNVGFQGFLSTPVGGFGSTAGARQFLRQPGTSIINASRDILGNYSGKNLFGKGMTLAGTPVRFVHNAYWGPATNLTTFGRPGSAAAFRVFDYGWQEATGTAPFQFMWDPISEKFYNPSIHRSPSTKPNTVTPTNTSTINTTSTETKSTPQYKPVVVPKKIEFPTAYAQGRDTTYTINMGGKDYKLDTRTQDGKELFQYLVDDYGLNTKNKGNYDFKNNRFNIKIDPKYKSVIEDLFSEE